MNEVKGKADFRLDHTMIRVFDQGNAWGHFALKVSDVYATADYLKSQGVEFTREPGPMKAGTRIIAFFRDPDGYVIEVNEPLERP